MSSPAAALRPMTVGQLLDRTVSLYRRNFLLFFGIAALPSALLLAAQLAMRALGLALEAPPGAVEPVEEFMPIAADYAMVAGVVVLIVAGIVYLVGYALSMAATIHAVAAVHLGRSTGIREAYARLRGRVGRIVNVMLSVLVRVFGGGLVLFLAGIALTAVIVPLLSSVLGPAGAILGGIVAMVALIGAFVLMVILFLRYSIAVQACVLENIKARQALRRSVALTRGGRGRILVIYIVVVVLTYVIMIPLYIPLMVMAYASAPAWMTESLNYLVGFLVGTLVAPIGAIALSLVYYDERVRKEALDIELMMAALDQPQNPNAPAPGYAG